MGCSGWMHGRCAGATCWRSCASCSKTVLQTCNRSGVADLVALAALVGRMGALWTDTRRGR
jgi:hypothetical protein